MTGKVLPRYVSRDGVLVPFADATVHVLCTGMKYAATVYEGIRGYWSGTDINIFRLEDHLLRLEQSAEMARLILPRTRQQIISDLLCLIRANEQQEDLHIRVLAHVDEIDGGLDSIAPVSLTIAAMPMGRYPETSGAKSGLDIAISHWQRIPDTSQPPRLKSSANYLNSRLALLQARADNYDDCVLLTTDGKLSEGPGYNVFIVRHGTVLTPRITDNLLEGITRDTILHLVRNRGDLAVEERRIDKTELYSASEAFFCGSGKEVRPIASVDRHALGEAAPGPVTRWVSEAYFDTVRATRPAPAGWLTPVRNGQVSP